MSGLSRAEVDEAIRTRLEADPAFRDKLLADPRAALAEIIGIALPDAVRVTVHEESLTDIHLVLPANTSDELSDNDLELVAGGSCWSNYVTVHVVGQDGSRWDERKLVL
jgi:hypothetical protein